MKTFSELNLAPPVQLALANMNYESPTDVQSKAIPLILEGRDVLVTAQTGTGKTAAFGIPMLHQMITRLEQNPESEMRRALIVAPTRELAEQIGLVFRDLTSFFRRSRYCVVIGGTPYGKQLRELKLDPAFVIGTPGRLLDHIKSRNLSLKNFEFLVLDEADRMLDMGFAPQVEAIIGAMPLARQTLMFSATLPAGVKNIVASYLKNPVRIAVGEENRAVDRIEQIVIEIREGEKDARLIEEIDQVAGTIIVFTKTKAKADRVARMLAQAGHEADALHGDLTQSERKKVTNAFRVEKIRILVATDIAARGLDIDHIRHVVNYDVPMVEEDYIHRIGRTARAGKDGHSIAFVTPSEKARWARILRMMGIKAPHVSQNPSRDGRNGGGAPKGPKSTKPGTRGARFTGDKDLRDGVRDPKLKIDGSIKGAFGDRMAKSRAARGEDPATGPRPTVGSTRGGNRPVPNKHVNPKAPGERKSIREEFGAKRAGGGKSSAAGFSARPSRTERPPARGDRSPARGERASAPAQRPVRASGGAVRGGPKGNRPARPGERPLSASPRAAGYNSPEARSIREEFEARVKASESGRGFDAGKAAKYGERDERSPRSKQIPMQKTMQKRGANRKPNR